jgi:hypothetical protein
MALGAPRLVSVIIAIRLVALFALIPLGFIAFGLVGAIWGIVLSQLPILPAVAFFNNRFGLLDVRRELLLLVLFFVATGVAALCKLAIGL